jgi:hypothetical protein
MKKFGRMRVGGKAAVETEEETPCRDKSEKLLFVEGNRIFQTAAQHNKL